MRVSVNSSCDKFLCANCFLLRFVLTINYDILLTKHLDEDIFLDGVRKVAKQLRETDVNHYKERYFNSFILFYSKKIILESPHILRNMIFVYKLLRRTLFS